MERMLIHMPTGTGKTKTTMHIITNYINFSLSKQGIVIWVAHTIELLQQAYDTFESVWKHLGDGKIKIRASVRSSDKGDEEKQLKLLKALAKIHGFSFEILCQNPFFECKGESKLRDALKKT